MRGEASPATAAGWKVDSEENLMRCEDWPESADCSEGCAELGNGGQMMMQCRLL